MVRELSCLLGHEESPLFCWCKRFFYDTTWVFCFLVLLVLASPSFWVWYTLNHFLSKWHKSSLLISPYMEGSSMPTVFFLFCQFFSLTIVLFRLISQRLHTEHQMRNTGITISQCLFQSHLILCMGEILGKPSKTVATL